MLWPGVASGKIDWMNVTAHARRAALRQAHRQTVLTAAPGTSTVHAQQHMLDRMQVPTARGRVVIDGHRDTSVPGYSPGADAAKPTATSPTTLHLTPGYGDTPAVFEHELGHAFDYANMTDAARQRFLALMHYKPNTKWWGDSQLSAGGLDAYSKDPPAAEQFADVYRILAQHANKLDSHKAWAHFRSNYGVDSGNLRGSQIHRPPTFWQARKIETLLQSLG